MNLPMGIAIGTALGNPALGVAIGLMGQQQEEEEEREKKRREEEEEKRHKERGY